MPVHIICLCHAIPVRVCSVAGPIIGGVIGGITLTLIVVVITVLVWNRGKLIFDLLNKFKKW